MTDALQALLAAAVRAPSGDNTQPWRFLVDTKTNRIDFYVDETRDPSPMNAGQRMARIAVGATLENVLRTAALNGWKTTLEEPTPSAVASVQVESVGGGSIAVDDALVRRVTNRRAYDGRPLPAETLARLREKTPPLEGVATHWIVERERLDPLADLIGRCDATMFGERSMRRAFLANIRFDAPARAEVEEGLSLASLELSPNNLRALKLLRWTPGWLLRLGGGLRQFASAARRLVVNSSGLCLLSAPDRQARTDVAVGRAMERAWLALTVEGLVGQPMMSLPVLDNALENGRPDVIAALGPDRVRGLIEEARRQVPEIGEGRFAWVMRFGTSDGVSGRTGRLPVSARVGEADG